MYLLYSHFCCKDELCHCVGFQSLLPPEMLSNVYNPQGFAYGCVVQLTFCVAIEMYTRPNVNCSLLKSEVWERFFFSDKVVLTTDLLTEALPAIKFRT